MPLGAAWKSFVLGADIHWNAAPFPMPLPYPYIGLIYDPIGEWIAAQMGALLGSPMPGPVLIGSDPLTETGQSAYNWIVLPHIPWTGSWVPLTIGMPSGIADLPFGSKTVKVRSGQAVRSSDQALSCSDPVNLPLAGVLGLQSGSGPVLVGGPQGVDAAVLAMSLAGNLLALGLDAVGSVAWRSFARAIQRWRPWRAGRVATKLARRAVRAALGRRVLAISSPTLRSMMAQGVCALLGDPVDPATGRVVAETEDFVLPGPIPLVFKRHYDSSLSWRALSCGFGWSHSLEQAVWLELGKVVYRTSDGRHLEWTTLGRRGDTMHVGESLYDREERLTLRCVAPFRWEVETHDDGLVRELAPDPSDAHVGHADDGWAIPVGPVARLERIRTKDGHHAIDLSYDARTGALAGVVDSGGRRVRFDHDELGRLVGVHIPHPHEPTEREQIRFTYSPSGDLVEERDAFGKATRNEYDGHLLVRWTDRVGIRWSYQYDGHGSSAWCTRVWGEAADGLPTPPGGLLQRRFAYDKANGKTWVTDGLGRESRYEWRPDHRIVRVVNQLGGVTETTWDEHGQVSSRVDPAGRTTRYARDERGRLIRAESPGGDVTELAWDEHDRLVSIRDARGGETRYRHDHEGHLVEEDGPTGERIRIQWLKGLPHVVESRGLASDAVNRSELSWDRAGQLAAVRDHEGVETQLKYDRRGRLLERRLTTAEARQAAPRAKAWQAAAPAPALTERFRWSAEDRLAQWTDALGLEHIRDTDAEGRLTSVGTALGKETFGYDGLPWITTRAHEDGTTLRVERNGEGQPTALVNELGERHELAWSGTGDLAAERTFDGRLVEHRRVLETGELQTTVAASGARTTFGHDSAGRIEKIVWEGPLGAPERRRAEARFRYDAMGALVEAMNATGTVRFERDAAGRVVRETFLRRRLGSAEPASEEWVASSWGPRGRIGISSSRGLDVELARDGRGRARSLVAWAGPVGEPRGDSPPVPVAENATRVAEPERGLPRRGDPRLRVSFDLDAFGNEREREVVPSASSVGPAVTLRVRWRRDALGRPLERQVWTPTLVLDERGYRWSARHELEAVIDPATGSRRFGYDERSRLFVEEQSEPGGRKRFDYRTPDPSGNLFATRDRRDRVFAPGGRITEEHTRDGTVRYQHDEDGRRIAKILPDGSRHQYRWAIDGTLREVERPDGTRVAYRYDALGRRVERSISTADAATARTFWQWDGDDPLHEWSDGFVASDRAPSPQRAGEPDLLDELRRDPELITWLHHPDEHSLLARIDARGAFTVVPTVLGVADLLLDSQGRTVWRADTTIWGQASPLVALVGCPLRFPGQWWDESVGLSYNRHRWYDPGLGAYLSPDPLGLVGGLHPYAYVDNPWTEMDPLGLVRRICRVVFRQAEREFQGLVEAAAASVGTDWSRIRGLIGRPSYDATVTRPYLVARSYGRAVEQRAAEIVDERGLTRFLHVGDVHPGPDFVGRGPYEGLNFDATTFTQSSIERHLQRPGYGEDLILGFYQRPSGLWTFPSLGD